MRGREEERERGKHCAVERQHYTVGIKEHLGFPPLTMPTWIRDKEDRRTSVFWETRKVIEKGGREEVL